MEPELDENEQAMVHQVMEAAKAEKSKLKKARKNAKKGKSQSDGQFWWNNSVYASW